MFLRLGLGECFGLQELALKLYCLCLYTDVAQHELLLLVHKPVVGRSQLRELVLQLLILVPKPVDGRMQVGEKSREDGLWLELEFFEECCIGMICG